mmetsp:Transcript_15146/g.25943  ORF Transcript_15146/g.25943 Transcript_15146/m.25943 type:complete len:333 (-) Transcript_15146:381-1379(-)|eukprot:CAMPEP_0196658156 /NCGR_PEP_ID=MMETSP1086-20130531/27696_1 /TAXON_ID=77921 /ORGANISM="Cyanoptyche  gloeocystis , Strain SAG4.97" /LENGTH=332 /DNA_ID=CAMNT_0041991601 /DNA_START=83 /DNA_END=1081 /DNA_ORIENTATION=+
MFGSAKKKDPAADAKAARLKQVESLLALVPGTKALDAERTMFEVQTRLPSRMLLCFRIQLPPNFPNEPPAVTLAEPKRLEHAWLDRNQYVVYPKLFPGQWRPTDSLGRTIQDVLQEFSRNPPTCKSPATMSSSSSASRSSPKPLPAPQRFTAVPSVPVEFPELRTKTSAELETMLQDQETFDGWLKQQPGVVNLKNIRDQIAANNALLNQRVNELEERVRGADEEYEPIRIALDTKMAQLDQVTRKKRDLLDRETAGVQMQRLQEGADEVDGESQRVAERMCSGGVDAKQFISEYLDLRRRYHSRMARREWAAASAPVASTQSAFNNVSIRK